MKGKVSYQQSKILFHLESSTSWLNDEESLQPVLGARTSHD